MLESNLKDYIRQFKANRTLDFPELTREDVLACLSFAADRERKSIILA